MPPSLPEPEPLSRCEPAGLATPQTARLDMPGDGPGVSRVEQHLVAVRGSLALSPAGGRRSMGPGVTAVCRAVFQAAVILVMKAPRALGSP